MSLTVPNAVNYPSPLTMAPSLMQDEPTEGRWQIAAEIDWAVMGGAARSVSFNLQQNATLAWTQIATIKVDNSQCGVDVRFLFTDTGETITIPAYTAEAVLPVFSNARTFYVTGAGSLTGDVTRFVLLNYKQDPVVLPGSTGQENNASGPGPFVWFAVMDDGTDVILPSGINGTITGIYIGVSVDTTTAAAQVTGALIDGGGHVIGQYILQLEAMQGYTGEIMSMSDLDIHFSDGIDFVQGPGNVYPAGGTGTPVWTIYVFYRTTA